MQDVGYTEGRSRHGGATPNYKYVICPCISDCKPWWRYIHEKWCCHIRDWFLWFNWIAVELFPAITGQGAYSPTTPSEHEYRTSSYIHSQLHFSISLSDSLPGDCIL